MKAQEIIDIATKEIGTVESPANSNNVKYNTWFYNKQVIGASYPWCAVFISWVFRNTNLVKKTASCVQMLEWFEAHNQIVKKPQAGDIVFFKYKTNNRRTNHVGLVIEVHENYIMTIEGNTSTSSNDNGGKVMKRKRSSNIVGYARPKYDSSVSVVSDDRPLLRKGSRGTKVKYLQKILAEKKYYTDKIDGVFGINTRNAVLKFQRDHNLTQDGIVGKNTWIALEG